MHSQELCNLWKRLILRAQSRLQLLKALTNKEFHTGQVRFLERRPPSFRPCPLYTSILATGRRWGKTELISYDALEYALMRPQSRQCIASISQTQARIAWDIIVAVCSNNPLISPLVAQIRQTPFPEISFRTGSRITARSTSHDGKYLRGHKFDRVFVDEAEYVKDLVIEDVVRLVLADTGGELILTTTPRRRGSLVFRSFMDIVSHPRETEYAQSGNSFENPFINHEYLRALQERMSREAWQREVEGVWTSSEGAVFEWDDVQRAYETVDWEIPEPPQPNRRYVAGWDLAKEEDFTVGVVIDATELPLRVVDWERFHRLSWTQIKERIEQKHEMYRCERTLVDSTGVGAVVQEMLGEVATGFVFTKQSKADLIYNLQVLIQQTKLLFPFIRELVDELSAYQLDDRNITQDCVMALGLACWAASPIAVRTRAVSSEDILLSLRS